jgi:hypothetical protein
MNPNYILGSGLLPQLILAIILGFILYVGMTAFDGLARIYKRMGASRVELMPDTYSSEVKSYQIRQNPNLPDAKTIFMSDNELTGVEFSYSFYMNINKNNFDGNDYLKHVFHKGNSELFPLFGPGVFVKSNENIMRIYMNSYKTWNNFCDVTNIPVAKWFHCALVYKNDGLEVYINGNLKSKLSLADSVPYQNYGDYYFFSMKKLQLTKNGQPCINENLNIQKSFNGMLSRVRYYNYALAYSEIQALVDEGPSNKVDATNMGGVPPYLKDNWWVS